MTLCCAESIVLNAIIAITAPIALHIIGILFLGKNKSIDRENATVSFGRNIPEISQGRLCQTACHLANPALQIPTSSFYFIYR